MKKVSAVIVNWNRFDDTRACLESLKKSNLPNIELKVVIVDNGSKETEVDSLKDLIKGSNEVSLIENKKNLGFSGGNNVGIKHVMDSSDYILIINNDTLVDPNMVSVLVESFEKYSDLTIASPKIYFAPGFEFHKKRYKPTEFGKVIWYAGGNIDWNNVYGKNIGVDEVDKAQFEKDLEIDFATGACMLVKVEAFKKVGFFDERYFAYMEDVDFSVRAKKSGGSIKYIPKAYLWHKVSQSSSIGSDLNDYFITRNRLLLGISYAKLKTKLSLVKESLRFLANGRKWQRKGVVDFYRGNLGKGSWK